jgi:hypothetical protein
MPNLFAASTLVVSAAKWPAMSVPPDCSYQRLAESAFVIVSAVVKVFEAIRNSVCSGARSRSTPASSWPSTFETK